MDSEILNVLAELSQMSMETAGASFNIQHDKKTGGFKVVFVNKRDGLGLTSTDFLSAIKEGRDCLKKNRQDVVIKKGYRL